MRIDVLTLFPEMFSPVLGASIMKRAISKKVVQVHVRNLRDWSREKHRKVDDRPYGGGPGMVMKPEPFFEAVDDLKKREARKTGRGSRHPKPHVVLLCPQGKKLTQRRVQKLSKRPWLIFLCGHYEGVDERVRLRLADEELSVGDYILTCGELPAMVLIDSVVRLVPGALGDPGSTVEESFCGNLLEYPHYTRPAEYRGMRVPQVLVCGDFSRVSRWRKLQAHRRTKQRRPDLIHGSSNSSH